MDGVDLDSFLANGSQPDPVSAPTSPAKPKGPGHAPAGKPAQEAGRGKSPSPADATPDKAAKSSKSSSSTDATKSSKSSSSADASPDKAAKPSKSSADTPKPRKAKTPSDDEKLTPAQKARLLTVRHIINDEKVEDGDDEEEESEYSGGGQDTEEEDDDDAEEEAEEEDDDKEGSRRHMSDEEDEGDKSTTKKRKRGAVTDHLRDPSKFKCSACGGTGHKCTSRDCPKYVKGGKRSAKRAKIDVSSAAGSPAGSPVHVAHPLAVAVASPVARPLVANGTHASSVSFITNPQYVAAMHAIGALDALMRTLKAEYGSDSMAYRTLLSAVRALEL